MLNEMRKLMEAVKLAESNSDLRFAANALIGNPGSVVYEDEEYVIRTGLNSDELYKFTKKGYWSLTGVHEAAHILDNFNVYTVETTSGDLYMAAISNDKKHWITNIWDRKVSNSRFVHMFQYFQEIL